MKKFTRFMMIALLVSSFSGCNKIKVKDGTEAAKILLANERLDGSDLRKDGNIFTKGKKAFDRIKTETQKYSKRLEEEGVKSKFNKSGNTYMLSSGLGFECDYIELSELDKLLSQEKQLSNILSYCVNSNLFRLKHVFSQSPNFIFLTSGGNASIHSGRTSSLATI